jgi:hypothetical protein
VTSASLAELAALNDWAELLVDGVADSRLKTEGERLEACIGLGLRTDSEASVSVRRDLSCRLRSERSGERVDGEI